MVRNPNSSFFRERGPALTQRKSPSQERNSRRRFVNPFDAFTDPVNTEFGAVGAGFDVGSRMLRFTGGLAARGAQEVGALDLGSERSEIGKQKNEERPTGGGPDLREIGGFFGGDLVPSDEDTQSQVDGIQGQIDTEKFAINQEIASKEAAISANLNAITGLDGLAAHLTTPEAQEQLQQIRSSLASALVQANKDYNVLQQRVELANRMFDEAERMRFEEEGGLLPGATDEQLAILDRELGSFSEEDAQAGFTSDIIDIIDSITESTMSDVEKTERLDFMLDKSDLDIELQGAINQLIVDRKDMQRMLDMPDSELLGQVDPETGQPLFGVEDFSTPQLNMDLQIDPTGRFEQAVGLEVEQALEQHYGKNIPIEVQNQMVGDDQNPGIMDLVLMSVAQPGAGLEPGSDALFARVSQMVGGDPTVTSQVMGAIDRGVEAYYMREEAWATALDKDYYRPGSYDMIAAIMQTALGIPGVADSAEGLAFANSLALDRNIHAIVQTKSGGQIGFDNGVQKGVGALTEEAYERIGMPYETIAGDPVGEWTALLLYMMEAGSPAARVATYFQTSQWGR